MDYSIRFRLGVLRLEVKDNGGELRDPTRIRAAREMLASFTAGWKGRGILEEPVVDQDDRGRDIGYEFRAYGFTPKQLCDLLVAMGTRYG